MQEIQMVTGTAHLGESGYWYGRGPSKDQRQIDLSGKQIAEEIARGA